MISLNVALFFVFTFVTSAIYFNDPRHQNVDLQGWMTPRYVVLSYDVPREVIRKALSIGADTAGQGLTIKDIAKEQDLDLNELTQRVRREVQSYREAQK